MNNRTRVPIYMYFVPVFVLFVGWIFTHITNWHETREAGFALIVLLIIFEVTAVILRSLLREQHHLDHNSHTHNQA